MAISTVQLFKSLKKNEKDYISRKLNDYVTNPLLSKKSLAEDFANKTELKTNRKGIDRLIKYLGIPDRDPQVIKESRIAMPKKTITNKVKAEQTIIDNKIAQKYNIKTLKEAYLTKSLTTLSEDLDVSIYHLTGYFQRNNIKLKDNIDYKDIIEILQNNDINKKDLEKYYLTPNNSFADFKNYITDNSNVTISNTSTYRLLKHLNILKEQDLIAYQRGKKSRKELLDNLDKLKKAGFDDRQALAEYYEENLSLTYNSLVKELNHNLGETFFTERWLNRHLTPFLSENRRVGVSRGELGLLEFIKTIYKGKIITNDRTLIKPKEIDIYLPDLDLALEFNGDYWHSDKFMLENHKMTARDYHSNKAVGCLNKNVRLAFVWETDWNMDNENIKLAVQNFIEHNVLDPILYKL